MNNFKHLPEPFRIRVIEPVKRTTREHRDNAIIEAGMNPFLLDSGGTDIQRSGAHFRTHSVRGTLSFRF